MPRTVKKKPAAPPPEPLFEASDFANYLAEKSALIAPADVEAVVARGDELSAKAVGDADHHPLMRRQVDVALQLLTDHDAGACPQIPYHSVALLAVAALYLLDPNDVIPDFLPDIGTSDDALVLELAFELGAAGIERYCTWKDIPVEGLFARRSKPSPRPRKR
jgi:uncharacterized membrane protein YkvA (DUF1232 family)